MARPSRHITEAALGRLDLVDELLWTNDEPPPSPYGDQSAPLRNRHGDIIKEVIEQPPFCGCGSQANLIARIRQAMDFRAREPIRRAVGVRHSRSLRRVFE
jgi:hypothetical protein